MNVDRTASSKDLVADSVEVEEEKDPAHEYVLGEQHDQVNAENDLVGQNDDQNYKEHADETLLP